MKSDPDHVLKEAIIAELAWDPAIDARAIGVAVNDGIVTLAGVVSTFAEKAAAAEAVRRLKNVKLLALEVEVRLAIPHRPSDGEIAAHLVEALRWNTLIPPGAVQPTVEQGRVTLQGEVPWEFQRRAAVGAVAPVLGVVEIGNEIVLRRGPRVADMAERIEAALARQANREASRVRVAVDGATVKLTGLVDAWRDRETAEAAAWSVPGVERVVNELISV